jgi:hypothetical protein
MTRPIELVIFDCDDWEDEFQHLYREAFAAELTPVDGIVEALDQIALPTCVASSGSHEKMRYTLGLAGLYDRFAGRIFSASESLGASPPPISSSMRPSGWARILPRARLSRTADTASRRRAPRACSRSASRAD